MKVLVDTGATNSIIHQSSLSKIRHYRIYPVQQQFFLANKTCISITGYVTLEIKIQHIKTYVTAAITRTLCYDVILGEDWINRYQVTINRFKNKIEILGNKATVPLRTSFNKSFLPITLKVATSIPPHTERIIEACTSIRQATKALFSPDLHFMNHKNLLLIQAIIQIQNNSTKLVITNTNDYPVQLERDAKLGFVSLLDKDDQVVMGSEIGTQHFNDTFINNVSTSQQALKWSSYVNAINNSTEDILANSDEMEKTLDQAIQHIEDLEEKLQTKSIIGKYRKVFDTSSSTIAYTSIPHTIPTGDHPPINSVPYRGSIEQQQALKKIIDQLEKSNQIRPSSSPWSSPVLLIKKKTGDYRFVVDYRKLNAVTVKDSFPIPTIESTLQQLAGNSYFSKLDLRAGYFQIPINEIDKSKTAFITTTGLWEFNVLPMGLTNAPPSFQRIMYNLVVNGHEDYCLVYLDDIIIFSKTFHEHLNHLNEILNILDQHNFQLNPIKCSIMKKKIDYLGHSINEYGITSLHDNIKAIQDLPIPDQPTLKQANEFIGGLGFYRKFIKNFSKIAAPIHQVTNLTKDNKYKFKWNNEQREAVRKLKQIITGPELVLEFPDPKLPYVLSTDASRAGLGAVLKQVTVDGEMKVIYYLSRMLTAAELKYSTTELEALAMVWAITKLRPYLLGRDFKVETDHCPLCQFHKKRSRNGRLDRWAIEILSEYNITEIKYKKGKCHCDADLLSRYPLQNHVNQSNETITRKQTEGYLFPHTDEVDDSEVNPQPTATINVITRSATRANVNQHDKDARSPIIDNGTRFRTNASSLDDEILSTNAMKVYNTRSKAKELQKKYLPSSRMTINNSTSLLSTNRYGKAAPSSLKINNSTLSNTTAEVPLSYDNFSMTKIKEEQMKDNDIQEKFKDSSNSQDWEVIDGILYKLVPRGKTKVKLLYIPKSLINQVLFLNHDHHTAAHLGSNKTVAKLVNKYYWPNMYKSINDYVRSCAQCSKHNYRRTKSPGKMNITPAPDEVMGLVGMDYWGPTEQPTAEGNRYVVTMTDYLSKFVFARAVKTNSAQEAADFFLDVCYHYGAPTKLITDQGSHFIAELTRTIINSCNTTHVLVTPYHPRSNAQTERFNATFAPALSKLMGEEKQNWDHLLQPIIYAYNTSQHSTTALTPFNLMFGRENLLLMDPKQMKVSLSKPNEYYEKVKKSRKFIIDYAKVNIEYRNKVAKMRYDRNRPDPHYNLLDLVLVRVINKSSKLQEKYEGPYRIIAQKGPSTFIVKIEDPDGDFNPTYTKQVTTSDMKPVFSRQY